MYKTEYRLEFLKDRYTSKLIIYFKQFNGYLQKFTFILKVSISNSLSLYICTFKLLLSWRKCTKMKFKKKTTQN